MTHIGNARLELEAAFNLGEIPPSDTLARALWRGRFMAATLYDEFDNEPQTALSDMVADLMHLAASEGVDFDDVLTDARWTRNEELKEWRERGWL
jgi:hypothetical protein